jgi:hypothetical protein
MSLKAAPQAQVAEGWSASANRVSLKLNATLQAQAACRY